MAAPPSATAAGASAATPASAAAVGPTRKTLFRKSGDGELTAPEVTDGEEQVNQNDKALVEEMLSGLRDAVKEMDRDNWLYEAQDPNIGMRIVV